MPEWLDDVTTFIRQRPYVAAVVVVVAGGLFIVFRQRGGDPASNEAQQGELVNPLSGTAPSYPPVILNQPSLPPPEPQQAPPRAMETIYREGRFLPVTPGPPGLCPPGYVSAQAPGQPPRCTIVDPRRRRPGDRGVYYPSLGQTQRGRIAPAGGQVVTAPWPGDAYPGRLR